MPTLPAGRLAELDARFALSKSGNSEILFAWLMKSIESGYTAAYPAIERFLTSMGRRKFLLPIYTDLMKSPDGAALARRIYKVARPTYHPVSQASVDGLLR